MAGSTDASHPVKPKPTPGAAAAAGSEVPPVQLELQLLAQDETPTGSPRCGNVTASGQSEAARSAVPASERADQCSTSRNLRVPGREDDATTKKATPGDAELEKLKNSRTVRMLT
ncbi:hypothetical protein CYMTET_22710 [Cymbomonas tetramitiformis]|uniref:Uncharacterized protein n=1 Tax=Cymbomonas tetramitiformis TaxID=36881 RepID=A0AAE0L1P0_9CHLO|nr:hypothetical protein CYMTET_22710 [Cymbomonas tetramitiformis]